MGTAIAGPRPRAPSPDQRSHGKRPQSPSPMSREREVELVQEWQRDRSENAARELLAAQAHNVRALARKYSRYGPRIEELVAEGNAGLAKALERFDVERETRFVTYAAYWIRAYMVTHALRAWSIVRDRSGALSSRYFFRLRRERAKVLALGELDVAGKLAERMGKSREEILKMLHGLDQRDLSLDQPSDGVTPLCERLPAVGQDAESQVFGEERRALASALVHDALAWLDQRERWIVRERLMCSGEDRSSLAELGAALGVSRERVRQIEERAKRKLRDGVLHSDLAQELDWIAGD